jgi:hypothetical protein
VIINTPSSKRGNVGKVRDLKERRKTSRSCDRKKRWYREKFDLRG